MNVEIEILIDCIVGDVAQNKGARVLVMPSIAEKLIRRGFASRPGKSSAKHKASKG